MKKSALQPRSRKTPRGGRKIARMILQMSEAVKGMLLDWWFFEKVKWCVVEVACVKLERGWYEWIVMSCKQRRRSSLCMGRNVAGRSRKVSCWPATSSPDRAGMDRNLAPAILQTPHFPQIKLMSGPQTGLFCQVFRALKPHNPSFQDAAVGEACVTRKS